MSEFDFASAAKMIGEINKIVETCPPEVKEKAFELLFSQLFSRPEPKSPVEKGGAASATPATEAAAVELSPESLKLASNVQAFLRRHQISKEILDKLFMLDQEPMLPIYKIETKAVAQGALQKVLMITLENALLNNQFKAPYREVRDTCKEDGWVDKNFSSILKKNSGLFKGAITADTINEDAAVELTGEGQTRLAQVMKELSGTT